MTKQHKFNGHAHRVLEGLVLKQRCPKISEEFSAEDKKDALLALEERGFAEHRTATSWRATLKGIQHYGTHRSSKTL